MATSKKVAITQIFVNNSKTPTTIPSTQVEQIVFDDKLVPDPNFVNGGYKH